MNSIACSWKRSDTLDFVILNYCKMAIYCRRSRAPATGTACVGASAVGWPSNFVCSGAFKNRDCVHFDLQVSVFILPYASYILCMHWRFVNRWYIPRRLAPARHVVYIFASQFFYVEKVVCTFVVLSMFWWSVSFATAPWTLALLVCWVNLGIINVCRTSGSGHVLLSRLVSGVPVAARFELRLPSACARLPLV